MGDMGRVISVQQEFKKLKKKNGGLQSY